MRIFPFLEYFIYATGKNEKDFQVGIKLQEAQNYVPKDIQNKNKFHFIQRSMRRDFFLQIIG